MYFYRAPAERYRYRGLAMACMRIAIAGLIVGLLGSASHAQEPAKDAAPTGISAPPAAPAMIPGSQGGLRSQLEKILAMEQLGDAKEAENAIEELEIPEDSDWFTQVFGSELGPKLAASYKLSWDAFRDNLTSHFRSEVEVKALNVETTVYPDPSGHTSNFIASHIISDMKTPTPLYSASTVGTSGNPRPLPGYYIYAQGAFRIVNLQTFYVLPGVRPMRIRIGENVAKSSLIYQAIPTYPPEAKKKRHVGTVLLHAIIGVDGTVQQLEMANPDKVDPLLGQAAMDAVKQWRYKPTLLNGDPVEVDTTISMTFKLGNR
jgi:TonB family protein